MQGFEPLKAATGTTTALFAHLDEALWLAKALLQTLTTSFVLNTPRIFRKNDVIRVCNAFGHQPKSLHKMRKQSECCDSDGL